MDNSSTLPTLGKRILEGEASWNQNPSFKGEFSFTKELCEAWYPKTNSLLTSAGELSISLWDVHVLYDLPISGDIYDEHIPSALELIGSDADHRSTPQCCGDHNQKDEDRSVHVNEWIEFWSRRPQVYGRLIPKKRHKRNSRPKNTQNPNGKIPAFKDWTKATRTPFVELGIPPKLQEETHLAAYLSYWLCVFVLPIKATRLIRYTTFKMASLMARGQTLNLAILVLASIYNGLNAISNSTKPMQADSRFSLHYVYGWLSFYYDTHFANDLASASPLMITYSREGGARTPTLAYWARMNVESHLQRVSNASDNVEMPVSGEAESSNKRMTGSDIGESEHSNNAPIQGSLRSQSSHGRYYECLDKLRGMLEKNPVEHISSVRESFDRAFANLHKLDLDISPLEARVKEVFEKTHKFDELRSTISEKISSESQGVSLSTAKDELKNAQDKYSPQESSGDFFFTVNKNSEGGSRLNINLQQNPLGISVEVVRGDSNA
nr:uncharacterized protein LOC105964676 [Ipomoea batatas]